MSTIQQIASRMNQEVVESIIRTVEAMPAEKQTWRPMDEGRSALEQLQECAMVNTGSAGVVRNRVFPPIDREAMGKAMAENDTVEKAIAALRRGTAELCAAIEECPDEHLEDTITLPFRGGTQKLLAEFLWLPCSNAQYHLGQINYIQTLYGDREMH